MFTLFPRNLEGPRDPRAHNFALSNLKSQREPSETFRRQILMRTKRDKRRFRILPQSLHDAVGSGFRLRWRDGYR